MAKTEWGLKRICPSCSTRYYDMKKNPPVCPSCGTVFDPENLVRSRRGRTADKKAAVAAPSPEEVIEDIPAAEGNDTEDSLIEDAEELGANDVEEVVEVEE
ncbi:MAG: TIGR02300 family protein [Alphaproteobacteria bacterium]|nr:TIGR02300 family protein [Alphaproteobacteria bacterium]